MIGFGIVFKFSQSQISRSGLVGLIFLFVTWWRGVELAFYWQM